MPDDPLPGLIEIPAGAFLTGSDKGRDPAAFDKDWAFVEDSVY
jgi:hypothetical protein